MKNLTVQKSEILSWKNKTIKDKWHKVACGGG